MSNNSRHTQNSRSPSTPHSIEGSCSKGQCVYTKEDYETKENKKTINHYLNKLSVLLCILTF